MDASYNHQTLSNADAYCIYKEHFQSYLLLYTYKETVKRLHTSINTGICYTQNAPMGYNPWIRVNVSTGKIMVRTKCIYGVRICMHVERGCAVLTWEFTILQSYICTQVSVWYLYPLRMEIHVIMVFFA
jgi:hypothetical protein